MKLVIKEIMFLLLILVSYINSNAQYQAIDYNATQMYYLDDYADSEYDFTSIEGSSALVQHNIGYSFSIAKHYLLNLNMGIGKNDLTYILNPDGPPFVTGDRTIEKINKVRFLNIGIESSYWINDNYTGWFFNGRIAGHFVSSAESETFIRVYNDQNNKFEGQDPISSSFKSEVESIVPVFQLGVGYNLRVYSGLHLFANLIFDYRPNGFFKNTQNITHLERNTRIGIKYAFNWEERSEKE